MAPFIHAQVILPAASAIVTDEAINTFSFQGTTGTPAELAALVQPALEDFYNTASGSGVPISSFLARNRSRAADAVRVRYYDITGHLNGTAAGPPFGESTFTLGNAGATDELPEETALVLSFHGDDDTIPEFGPGTRPRSRHRGRVYIGPLTYDVASPSAPDYSLRPDTGLITALVDGGQALLDASVGWSVWSRRNAAMYYVVGGWVDNAFDNIRGRGPKATMRETWPAPV